MVTYEIDSTQTYPHIFEIPPEMHRDAWAWCHHTLTHKHNDPQWVQSSTKFKFKNQDDALRFWMRFGGEHQV